MARPQTSMSEKLVTRIRGMIVARHEMVPARETEERLARQPGRNGHITPGRTGEETHDFSAIRNQLIPPTGWDLPIPKWDFVAQPLKLATELVKSLTSFKQRLFCYLLPRDANHLPARLLFSGFLFN
jgi:hypothetical protein